MGRKEHKFHYLHFRGLGGFTLIEVLVGVALSSLIVLVLFEALTAQNRTYSIQDDMAEMQQNLRVAIETVPKEVMSAGLGKPAWSMINGMDASSWYSSATAYTPYRISSSGDNNSIDIVGCIDNTASHLSADASVGSTTITLNGGEGSNFNTTTKQDINIGAMENAKVTAVVGDSLTIDTNPSAGGNQGLQYVQPANTIVCLVKWVSYSLGSGNVLYVNRHQGDGDQPVAQDITAMTLSVSGKLLTISLTGRTRNPDRTTGQYITSQVTSKALLRN